MNRPAELVFAESYQAVPCSLYAFFKANATGIFNKEILSWLYGFTDLSGSAYVLVRIMRNTWKGLVCYMRNAEARNSLRIPTVWSDPPANRICCNCRIYWRTEKAQIRLRGCAVRSGPSLFAYNIRSFSWLAHQLIGTFTLGADQIPSKE